MEKKKEIDWAGNWFSFMEENGEFTKIIFIKAHLNTSDFQIFQIDHCKHDGVGGLIHLFKESGYSNIPHPILKDPNPANIIQSIYNFFECNLDNGKRNEPWKSRDVCQKGKAITPSWHIFSKDETQKILQKCKDKGVSYNSALLYTLNKIVQQKFLTNPSTSWWMIPVNMRGATNINVQNGNLASYICAKINPQYGLYDIHKYISSKLKRKYHFAAWWSINIGRYIGLKGMKRIIDLFDKRNHSWCGTFSNLGNWEVKNFHPEDAWVFTPPVTKAHPIGAGALIFNGHLSIALQIHRSVAKDPKLTQEILNNWKSQI